MSPTHFLALSFKGASLQHQYESLLAALPKLDRAIVRPLSTLHFTLGVLSLSPAHITDVVHKLHAIPHAGAIQANLSGLHSMSGGDSAHVVYTALRQDEGARRLQALGECIRSAFVDMDYFLDKRPLHLHCTVLNTRYAKGRRRRIATEDILRLPFEAAVEIDAFGLFEMGAGYEGYTCIASVAI